MAPRYKCTYTVLTVVKQKNFLKYHNNMAVKVFVSWCNGYMGIGVYLCM
jgi:hypothetical protein